MENAKELNQCLCCGSTELELTLDLNEQPLANSFKESPDQEEPYFPLRLNRCTKCSHLQLSHAVNPDLLFKHYLYVSGTSQTLKDYFDWFAGVVSEFWPEGQPPKSVLDIACNDGTQLDSFKALGYKTYGIDPAENLYEISSKNHEVICDYFNAEHVAQLKGKIDVLNAQNVFAHNDYPLDFLLLCKEIMHDDSMLFIQTSQADMVAENQFDTIYHEHLSFFNGNSMNELAKRAGLHLIGINKTPIHGNSYLFSFSKRERPEFRITQVLVNEAKAGLQEPSTYKIYAEKCKMVVGVLGAKLEELKAKGYVIAGYGAAAKGNTLINFGKLKLDFIIDDNPLKQGLYAPGSNIPVVAIDELDKHKDGKIAFVPLAWNFFEEISRKIKTKRDKEEDLFIKYFPTIEIK